MFKSWMWKQRSYREQFQGDEGNGGAGGTGDVQVQDDQQQAADETSEAEQQAAAQAAQQAQEDDEVVITIGDETPPAPEDTEVNGAPAPQWLKDLRRSDREKSKRIRELEQAAAGRQAATEPAAPTVGNKPTLEDCDFDSDRFETELTAWHERKRAADDQAAKARKEQEDAQAAWQGKLDAYKTAKAALKVPDFEDAEAVVLEALSQTQQGIILSGADSPEKLMYALGKNPAKLKELAAINDPVKYAFAVAKLETQLKVTSRKAPPAPERAVRGSAAGATGTNSELERLRAEADRTSDRSKVTAYLRRQQQAA